MDELTIKLDEVIALYRVELGKANRCEEFQSGPWLVANNMF
jgi:hypothetical protein